MGRSDSKGLLRSNMLASLNNLGQRRRLRRSRSRILITSEDPRKQNPKAFAFSSSNKAKCLQSRAVEKEQRRLHAPVIDRSYGEPAPYVVVVQGPPQGSKGGCNLQFVECPNDINGMIDAVKFADLTLLLNDGSYGFEMMS
ncbi:hypothetical protein JHK82_053187 [Glycine max]|nr:hypothetical protein JHK86_053034 [Glycine max]KAG4927415.1 hypothetical protein JHK85_053901 [Glycine max]KAG5083024.1 hypothetical protein JHK84_053062 [Glycine max]KAG5085790.1 hypothetical protein JHK82_053187 [Glycine max]